MASENIALSPAIVRYMELTPETYDRMNRLGDQLRSRLAAVFREMHFPAQVTGAGSLFGIHFTSHPVTDYRSSTTADPELSHRFFLGMFTAGILVDPWGTGCLSAAINEAQVDIFVETARKVLESLG